MAMKKIKIYAHIVSSCITIIAAIIGTLISSTTIFISEKSFSRLLDNEYFLMVISIIISLSLIILFSIIIYKIQKRRKEKKYILNEKIKTSEKEFLLAINDDVNKLISNGVYNE